MSIKIIGSRFWQPLLRTCSHLDTFQKKKHSHKVQLILVVQPLRLPAMTSSKRRHFNNRLSPSHMTTLWKLLHEAAVSLCCAGFLQPERRTAHISFGRTLPEAAVRKSVRREEPSSDTVPSRIVWDGLQRTGHDPGWREGG